MSQSDSGIGTFTSEAKDLLEGIDNDLVLLEECDPGSTAELVNTLFRSFHTLKGNAGFFEFEGMQSVAHAGEELLSEMREGRTQPSGEVVDLLLRVCDQLRDFLEHIGRDGVEGPADATALISELRRTVESSRGEVERLVAPPEGFVIFDDEPAPTRSPVAKAVPRAAPRPTVSESEPLKVDPELVDRLVALVGELVLARNQVVRAKEVVRDPHVLSGFQRLHQIASELQSAVFRTRMEPVSHACRGLPRLVRDVAKSCGKSATLVLEGASTELDRSLLRGIHDPLVHLVRNAVDHGLETPDQRAAASKPAVGTIVVKSYCESGQVHIQIRDDGGGIDPEKIASKVVAAELMSAQEVEALTDAQKQNLVFLPGLSTAQSVSAISGRGVGMDVVRSNVEKLGGSVSIDSKVGVGTTFTLKIPLTLAVTQGLVVRVGDENYIVPRSSIRQAIQIDGESSDRQLAPLEGVPTYRLRDRVLRVAVLRELLDESYRAPGCTELRGTLLVVRVGGSEFGLLIDSVADTAEIVVKSLGPHLDDLPLYAGATVLGDGSIAVILDVAGLAVEAGLNTSVADPDAPSAQAVETPPELEQSVELTSVVLVADGPTHAAVPLNTVGHFAHVRADQICRTSLNTSVSFRGEILPLHRLRELVPVDPADLGSEAANDSDISILVHNGAGGRRFGFAVERVLDLQTAQLLPTSSENGLGITGQVLIDDRAVDVIDLATLAQELRVAL